MKTITIRNVPPDLADALDDEKHRRGRSLNQTVLELLAQGLGLHPATRRSNGLARLAGTWTDAEHAEFEESIAATEQIDEELWR
jgi:plasmid stability protein